MPTGRGLLPGGKEGEKHQNVLLLHKRAEKSGHLRQEIKNLVKSLKCQKLKRAGKSSSSYSEIPVPPAGLKSELKQNYCL